MTTASLGTSIVGNNTQQYSDMSEDDSTEYVFGLGVVTHGDYCMPFDVPSTLQKKDQQNTWLISR